MKALTIKQPWASFIAHGIKDVENRTWKTNFRGKVLIHAAKKPVDASDDIFSLEQFKVIENNIHAFDEHTNGAIIGEVDIVDCVQNHPSIWAEKGVFNWVLANAVLYDKPIFNVKGKLSFWEFEP